MLVKHENKINNKLIIASLGTMLATTFASHGKVHADAINQNQSSVQLSKAKRVSVTSAQYAYYKQSQTQSNQEMAKIKAQAEQKAEQDKQAQQKQAQEAQQKAQAQNNQNQNNQNQNNNQNNATATGDNALKDFDNSSNQSFQQTQVDGQKLQQQAQQAQQANQDLNKKVQAKINQAPVATDSQSFGGNNNNQQNNNQAPTGSGSVYDQFIQAGGTPDMWKYIVMPESSGNPNAVNGRYSGLFQTDKGNGTRGHSVAQQTQWAIQYANERYGGVTNAIHFRQTHNFW